MAGVNDELLEDVGKILGLSGALTRTQWRDAHKTRSRSGEQLVWLAVLQLTLNDWHKHKSNPVSLTHAKNAKDIPNWIKGNSLTITLCSEAVAELLQIDEERLRKAIVKHLRLDEPEQKQE